MEKIYYPRTIDSYLLEWKNERAHKPLLLRGVRQVGKSSAVRQLGKTFKYFMEVNFERDKEIISVFIGNLKPKEITCLVLKKVDSLHFGIMAHCKEMF